MSDLPSPSTFASPIEPTPRRSGPRRFLLVALKFLAATMCFAVLFAVANAALEWMTSDGAIPPSCNQPTTVDYSHLGRPDYGPHSVKFTSWRHLPWGRSSDALVGHGGDADSWADYGLPLTIQSTDIGGFQCRWTNEGVTIVEPPNESAPWPPSEHFVPAEQFLGGR